MNKNDIKKNIKNIMDFPQKGILFRDISPILLNIKLMKYIIKKFKKHVKDADIIVSPDARGFLFGVPLSLKTNKPFVMIRKSGKLPGDIFSVSYDLEYGKNQMEIQKNLIKPNQKIVIVDDILATGGSAKALKFLINKCGAKVIRYLFVIELEFLKGRKIIEEEVISLIKL